MRVHDTFKERKLICEDLHQHKDLAWGLGPFPPCPECQKPTFELGYESTNKSAYVIGDECDVLIKHEIGRAHV